MTFKKYLKEQMALKDILDLQDYVASLNVENLIDRIQLAEKLNSHLATDFFSKIISQWTVKKSIEIFSKIGEAILDGKHFDIVHSVTEDRPRTRQAAKEAANNFLDGKYSGHYSEILISPVFHKSHEKFYTF